MKSEYTFRDQKLPESIRESLDRYVTYGIPPGNFLRAVLSNDLTDAIFRADLDNLPRIGVIVAYCYNELPSNCWGSQEKVKTHLQKFRKTL